MRALVSKSLICCGHLQGRDAIGTERKRYTNILTLIAIKISYPHTLSGVQYVVYTGIGYGFDCWNVKRVC